MGIKDELERRSVPVTESGCWICLSGSVGAGYAQFKVNGVQRRAHRVAYEAYKGPIPDGLFVCHSCDVPSCVNPDHLFLGTPLDNMLDKVRKGRAKSHRRVSAKDAEDIARLYKSGESIEVIASRHGLSTTSIKNHLKRKVAYSKHWFGG